MFGKLHRRLGAISVLGGLLLSIHAGLFAQGTSPESPAWAALAEKRANVLYVKMMQGMGSELFSIRNTLVEQLSPDNRTVVPDDLRNITQGLQLG